MLLNLDRILNNRCIWPCHVPDPLLVVKLAPLPSDLPHPSRPLERGSRIPLPPTKERMRTLRPHLACHLRLLKVQRTQKSSTVTRFGRRPTIPQLPRMSLLQVPGFGIRRVMHLLRVLHLLILLREIRLLAGLAVHNNISETTRSINITSWSFLHCFDEISEFEMQCASLSTLIVTRPHARVITWRHLEYIRSRTL